MADDIFTIRRKFDRVLRSVKGSPTADFTKITEVGYEALVCATAISEYAKILGHPVHIKNPVRFLNQKPGKFHPSKAFKVQFSTDTFFFATDVECHGLAAFKEKAPVGDIFEADVVIIKQGHIREIMDFYEGYPAPQHLEAAYECKFGKYTKSQLRELLGLRRHLSFVADKTHSAKPVPFGKHNQHAFPDIQVILFRSSAADFLKTHTADLYDLHQIVL